MSYRWRPRGRALAGQFGQQDCATCTMMASGPGSALGEFEVPPEDQKSGDELGPFWVPESRTKPQDKNERGLQVKVLMYVQIFLTAGLLWYQWSIDNNFRSRLVPERKPYDLLGAWAVSPLTVPEEVGIANLRAYSAIAKADLQGRPAMQAALVREGAPDIQHAEAELRAFDAAHGDIYGFSQGPLIGEDVILLAYSPDGSKVAVGRRGPGVLICDPDLPSEGKALPEFDGQATELLWSPDGQQLLARAQNDVVYIWRHPELELIARWGIPGVSRSDVAWNPVAARFFVIDYRGTCSVYQYNGFDVPELLRKHSDVEHAVWSPDGELLALTWTAGGVRVVADAGLGQFVEFRESNIVHRSLAWSPDGSMLAMLTKGGDIRLRTRDGEIASFNPPWRVEGARRLYWSPEGRRIAIATSSGPPQILDLDLQREPEVVDMTPWKDREVDEIRWSPDGNWIAFDCGYGQSLLYPVLGAHPRRVVRVADVFGIYSTIAWTNVQSVLAVLPFRDPIQLWNLNAPAEPIVFRSEKFQAAQAVWSPCGNKVAASTRSGIILIHSSDGKVSQEVGAQRPSEVTRLVWSRDGTRLAAVYKDGEMWLYSADRDQEPVVFKHRQHLIETVEWSSDGAHFATTANDKAVALWRINEPGKPYLWLRHRAIANRVAWSPSGDRVATGLIDGTARFWNADGTGQPIELASHKRPIAWLAWSPEGRRLATAGETGPVRVWWAHHGSDLQFREPLGSGIREGAWNADGTILALLLRNGEAWLVDAGAVPSESLSDFLARASAKEREDYEASHYRFPRNPERPYAFTRMDRLHGHEGKLHLVTWSSDGRFLLAVNDEGVAHIWNRESLEAPVMLRHHGIEAASFSPDGSRIMTLSKEGEIRIWTFAWKLLRERLWELIPRDLDADERRQYMGESPEAAQETSWRRSRERQLRQESRVKSR